ncbi:MAG TPA: zf-HC2 domain-containing protein [Thermoleophilia bacterium]|nr:zf-HC2 domain-containing protein [Thermoleophilia bacterium]
MKCAHVRKLMSPLIDGALEPAEADGVREHVRSCASCAAKLDAMQAADAGVRDALYRAVDGAEVSGYFTSRVLATIAEGEGKRIPLLWRPRVRRFVLAAASTVVVAIGVWVAVHFSGTKHGTQVVDRGPKEVTTHRAGIVFTTLDLPSVRDLARELLGEDLFRPESRKGPAGPVDDRQEQLNFRPGTKPTCWG